MQPSSAGWLFFVRASFAIAVGALALGIAFLPIDVWMRGYLAMGALFAIGSSFTLSKTIRDEHEAKNIVRKIEQAQTSALLQKHMTAELD
jgi:hypothetical protein